jgi:hypothetical protein
MPTEEETGRYDEESRAVLHAVGAKMVLLVVFDGVRGHGFSVSVDRRIAPSPKRVAEILRSTADAIERLPARPGQPRD